MIRRSFFILLHRNLVGKGNEMTKLNPLTFSVQKTFSQWHVVGALCLERKPVITQNLAPLEQKYFNMVQQMEVEKSFLSNHEKRMKEDKKIAEKMKKGEEVENVSKTTAQDFEDACVEELSQFKPAPRITEADVSNNRQSLLRKLDSSLLLVVKQKLGSEYKWILPQSLHKEGETLRQTAERALKELCPNHSKVNFMGNAPVGSYKYKYPKLIRGNGIIGAKVFFFKAQLLDYMPPYDVLNIKRTEDLDEHQWLTHYELEDYLQPVYLKTVRSFLFPDVIKTDDGDIALSRPSNNDSEENVVPSVLT